MAEEFERNFSERGEVGTSVCVQIEGETVVDATYLSLGYASNASGSWIKG